MTFCERMEQIEQQEGVSPKSQKNKKSENQSKPSMSKKRGRESSKQLSTDKYCMLHGPNAHPTSQCRILQAQAKCMKSTYKAQTPENKRKLREKQEQHAKLAESIEMD